VQYHIKIASPAIEVTTQVVDELPETAHTFIDENYEISSIIQVQKIEDNKQTISYKVMIMEESDKVSFKFSSDGNLLK